MASTVGSGLEMVDCHNGSVVGSPADPARFPEGKPVERAPAEGFGVGVMIAHYLKGCQPCRNYWIKI